MPEILALILVVALLVVAVRLWLQARSAAGSARAELAALRGSARAESVALAEQRARLRLVRELEEVAVRSASGAVASLEAVDLAVERDPDSARRGARRARAEVQEVVAQLRRIGTLATAPGAQAGGGAEDHLRPVAELIDDERALGLGVVVVEHGEPFALRGGAEAAVYRVLERALSNARQHGGPGTTAEITYRWTQTGLQLHVEDDGARVTAERAARPAASTGIDDDLRSLTEEVDGPGLAELRERVALFGGSVRAQRVPGIGFSVAAYFPTLRHHNGVHGVDLGARA